MAPLAKGFGLAVVAVILFSFFGSNESPVEVMHGNVTGITSLIGPSASLDDF